MNIVLDRELSKTTLVIKAIEAIKAFKAIENIKTINIQRQHSYRNPKDYISY